MSERYCVDVEGLDLKELLGRVRSGEAVTLLDSDGEPLAVVMPVNASPAEPEKVRAWDVRWEALAETVGAAWSSDTPAEEILAGMRR